MAHSDFLVETSKQSVDSVPIEIVQRVATVTDKEVTKLPSLYDTIDPEALDAVVNSVEMGPSPLLIRFMYAGHQVTINGDEDVSIESSNR